MIWTWPTVIANEIMAKWDFACVLAQAALTNYHRLGGLNKRSAGANRVKFW